MLCHFVALRCSSGSDSRNSRHPNSRIIPNASNTQKIPFQPIPSVKPPPMIGAATGATPLIAPIIAKCLCQLFTGEHICRDGTGDYDTAGTRNPL